MFIDYKKLKRIRIENYEILFIVVIFIVVKIVIESHTYVRKDNNSGVGLVL